MGISDKLEKYLNEKKINTYDEFIKYLGDALYKTTRALIDANTTNRITFERMFKKLPKKEAQELLDLAKKFEEFHPDVIDSIQRNIIDKK